MSKHSLGDIVIYTNKNTKTDVTGTLIAIFSDWSSTSWGIIEVIDNRRETPSWALSRAYLSPGSTTARRLEEKFDERGNSRSITCLNYVPMRSRNLVSALREYSPEQNGDTDEDI